MLLDNAAFLKALRKLYEDNRSSSVFVTFKSGMADKANLTGQIVVETEKVGKKAKQTKAASETIVLVRASNGKSGKKRTKISTAVSG